MSDSVITNLLQYAAERNMTPLATRNAQEILSTKIPAPDQVLTDFLDVGDIMAIIGKSKMRKSWFALQLGMCIALNKPFLGFRPTRPMRTLIMQLEVQQNHYERRVQRMARSLLGETWALADNLTNLRILHGRGKSLTTSDVEETVRMYQPEVVIVDPAYLLIDGESSDESMRAFTSAMSVVAELGSTVAYVHHDKKGKSGDSDDVDRGSGSGVMGRAWDCSMLLDPHAESADHTVVSYKTRNYLCPEPVACTWDNWLFAPDEDEAPEKETSLSANNKSRRASPLADMASAAIAVLPVTPIWAADAVEIVREELRVGEKRARAVMDHLRNPDLGVYIEERHERGRIKLLRRDQPAPTVAPWE